MEIRSRVHIPMKTDDVVFVPDAGAPRQVHKKRFQILLADIADYGFTNRCQGCRGLLLKKPYAVNHSEVCRERMRKELEKVGDLRLKKEEGKMEEAIHEEEAKLSGESSGSGVKRDRDGKEVKEEEETKEEEEEMEVDEEEGERPNKIRNWEEDNMNTDGLGYLSKGMAQFRGEIDAGAWTMSSPKPSTREDSCWI